MCGVSLNMNEGIKMAQRGCQGSKKSKYIKKTLLVKGDIKLVIKNSKLI